MQNQAYNIKKAKAPLLSGPLLAIVAWLVEWIPGVAYVLGKDSGLYNLRELDLQEPPTYHPFDVITFQALKQQDSKFMTFEESIRCLREAAQPQRFFTSSLDLNEAFKSGIISPVDIILQIIELIDEDWSNDKGIHALLKYDKEDMIKQACASAERYKTGQSIGPLDGVPIAVKDEMAALPYKSSIGTGFLELDWADSTIVLKLREQGAIIIGKTSMHEFGLDVTNANPNSGTPRNPYNPDHFPGGSSGGSAAIVASGICPIALGAGLNY